MNIKKQIILDDKDYERLVHDANLSNDEIKSKIASALTTDIVVSFDFNVEKKESNKLNTEDWALLSLMILFIFAMGVVSGWLAFNCSNHG